MTFNADIFKQNLQKWAVLFPQEAEKLSVLKEDDSASVCFPYLSQNPMEEAKEWFSDLNLKEVDLLYIYGIGLGHYYLAAKEWLHEKENRMLVFLEDNPAQLRQCFGTQIGTDIIEDYRVSICLCEQDSYLDLLLHQLSTSFAGLRFKVTTSRLYERDRLPFFDQLHSRLSFWGFIQKTMAHEYSNYGIPYYLNFYRNLFHLPMALPTAHLTNRFKGVPAIICGAGPSLDKNLSLLEQLGDRALIFAGATAMNAVNSHGFWPHFGVGIDPNEEQQTRLIMNTAYEVPYLYRNRWNHGALTLSHGVKLFVPGSSGHSTSAWFEEQLGLTVEMSVEEGFNVVTFSLSLAAIWGCNPIIFVGLDLAYTNKLSYQSGVKVHPLHTRKHDFRTKGIHDELLIQQDIYGQPTYTLWKWVGESKWFRDFMLRNPHVFFVNATEGGIGIPGIPNKPLAEVAEHLLSRPLDLRVWVHGDLKLESMPPGVNEERIVELLKRFINSLEKCVTYSIQAIHDKTVMEKLHREEGYQYLLTDFKEHYLRIRRFYRDRLKSDPHLSEEEKTAKFAEIENEELIELGKTAQAQIELIKRILNEKEMSKKGSVAVKPTNIKHAKDESRIYSFENYKMTIEDPILGIHYKEEEPLIGEEDTVSVYHSDGSLKIRHYQKEGKLHGPVIYYSPEGQILAESWYINGLQEGKATFFYKTGAVYGEEGYREGKKEGTHHYFYPNGILKTQIHYTHGSLDGEVLLYYPNGQLKRESHFSKGNREGKDLVWNDDGKIKMEAEFHENRPANIAKAWHSNGVLAQEAIYDSQGQLLTSLSWNPDGSVITDTKEDYFDQMTNQATLLTHSLEDLSDHLNRIAILTHKMDDSLVADFEDLKSSLLILEEVNKKLVIEAGLQSDNDPEAIWKNLTIQHEMQDKLGEMTENLKKELGHIQMVKTLLDQQLNKPQE